MATHLPVNHRLRWLYRGLSGATGVYLISFGVAGVVATRHMPFFGRGPTETWGLHTNMAFAVLSIVVGAVILVGVVIGRNVDRFVNMVGAVVFILAGLIMLPLSRTDLDILNYDVTAAVVSFIIGTILLLSGLYGRVGPKDQRSREEGFRENKEEDPVVHVWTKELPPKKPRRNDRFA
jgi:Domain of unknown function (DUF4383)